MFFPPHGQTPEIVRVIEYHSPEILKYRTDRTISSPWARFFPETLFSPPIMTTKSKSDELSPTYNDVSELASTVDQDELQLVIPR